MAAFWVRENYSLRCLKKVDGQPILCYKVWLAGSSLQPNTHRQEKGQGLKYLIRCMILSPGSIHWIGPLKKTLKLLVDRLLRFR